MRGKKTGTPNYKKDLLVDIVDKQRPKSLADWNDVAAMYQIWSKEIELRKGLTIQQYFFNYLCRKKRDALCLKIREQIRGGPEEASYMKESDDDDFYDNEDEEDYDDYDDETYYDDDNNVKVAAKANEFDGSVKDMGDGNTAAMKNNNKKKTKTNDSNHHTNDEKWSLGYDGYDDEDEDEPKLNHNIGKVAAKKANEFDGNVKYAANDGTTTAALKNNSKKKKKGDHHHTNDEKSLLGSNWYDDEDEHEPKLKYNMIDTLNTQLGQEAPPAQQEGATTSMPQILAMFSLHT